jgi:hypothetical protein
MPSGRPGAPDQLRRVRHRILAISCALLVLLSMSIWGFVRVMADRTVTRAIDADLTRAEQMVQHVQRDRLGRLALTARLVASFPELKALFATDAATVRDYLVSYRQRNPEVPLLVALSADGRVIARTDAVTAGEDDAWIGSLAGPEGAGDRRDPRSALPRGGGARRRRRQHLRQVVAAMPADETFAAALRKRRGRGAPARTQNGGVDAERRGDAVAFARRVAPRRRPDGSPASDRRASLRSASVLAGQPALSAVILVVRRGDRALSPHSEWLVLIGLLCVVVAAAGSLWIARTTIAGLQRP